MENVNNTVNRIDGERSAILDEIAMSDYKVIKAARLGRPVEELYPGITNWYNAKIARLREIESMYPESVPADETEFDDPEGEAENPEE